ncbi:hypothetical protein BD289DRAFT_436868 [Coniella lustricola]|uniref:Uncharacterized protein n=1 Tax=Coniella lustricola TaxID=2025994 RepID=A0A2T3A4M6_9PEZI|nr:hypothetical protein BD289DRAFT_436868 [Coniella lustricola]
MLELEIDPSLSTLDSFNPRQTPQSRPRQTGTTSFPMIVPNGLSFEHPLFRMRNGKTNTVSHPVIYA